MSKRNTSGGRDHSPNLLPSSESGRLAAKLLGILAGVFLVAVIVALAANGSDSGTAWAIYRLQISTAFLLAAVGAMAWGLIAAIRDRDFSIIVLLAIPIGTVATIFTLGDLV